jgi:predicted RNase H-like HicB family nuclease
MSPSHRMKMTIELAIRIIRKEKWYVTACPGLDVVSQGDSAEVAKEHLAEALRLFFTSCLERGTLEAVLKECGFLPVEDQFTPNIVNRHPRMRLV